MFRALLLSFLLAPAAMSMEIPNQSCEAERTICILSHKSGCEAQFNHCMVDKTASTEDPLKGTSCEGLPVDELPITSKACSTALESGTGLMEACTCNETPKLEMCPIENNTPLFTFKESPTNMCLLPQIDFKSSSVIDTCDRAGFGSGLSAPGPRVYKECAGFGAGLKVTSSGEGLGQTVNDQSGQNVGPRINMPAPYAFYGPGPFVFKVFDN